MIEVIKPGLFTTIQNTGRKGYRKLGIPECGATDSYSACLANWLVYNRSNSPLLEITISGPELKFNCACRIAITGAHMTPTKNNESVRLYETISVKPDDIISFGKLQYGCRAYMAVEGGFEANEYLGSTSTYTLAAFGGYKGRALKSGDILKFHIPQQNPSEKRKLPEYLHLKFNTPWKIRIIEGPEYDAIDEESPMDLAEEFIVHQNSDRMGIRLSGFFGEVNEKEIISSPVNTGTIQSLPGNELMVLMNDGQVTGGYPRLGNVISADLHLMAQVRPGDKVRLVKISLERAEYLNDFQHRLLQQYRENSY